MAFLKLTSLTRELHNVFFRKHVGVQVSQVFCCTVTGGGVTWTCADIRGETADIRRNCQIMVWLKKEALVLRRPAIFMCLGSPSLSLGTEPTLTHP